MLILENCNVPRMLIIKDLEEQIAGEEMKKVINNALDAKHRGWFNASQHNKQQLERKIAGEERKKTINDALDAKHRGW
jgi:hypothetical protein